MTPSLTLYTLGTRLLEPAFPYFVRQRLRAGVIAGSTVTCPHCAGLGLVRSIESTALRVLRGLEEEAEKNRAAANDDAGRVLAPVDTIREVRESSRRAVVHARLLGASHRRGCSSQNRRGFGRETTLAPDGSRP